MSDFEMKAKLEELFERGFFHDIYVEALRLLKENAEMKEELRIANADLETIRNYESSEIGKAHAAISELKKQLDEMAGALEHYESAHYTADNGVCAWDKTATKALESYRKFKGE